eukprot:2155878-Pleurochrysis_carterae.AAC.1
MPSSPPHSFELQLYPAHQARRIIWLQLLQVVENVRRVNDRAHHVAHVPHNPSVRGATDGELAVR